MEAISVRFGKDDSEAYILIGTIWHVDASKVSQLRKLLKNEFDVNVSKEKEFLHPRHNCSKLLRIWSELYGTEFTATEYWPAEEGKKLVGLALTGRSLERYLGVVGKTDALITAM